jgi:magnesium transporter
MLPCKFPVPLICFVSTRFDSFSRRPSPPPSYCFYVEYLLTSCLYSLGHNIIAVEKNDIASKLKIPQRDIRNVDSSFRNLPTIAVRPNAIIINLELARAIITAEECMLVGPLHPLLESRFDRLSNRLRTMGSQRDVDSSASDDYTKIPFEFVALEFVLRNVCRSLEARFATFAMSIQPLLESANTIQDPSILAKLLPLKYSLSTFQVSVKEISMALRQLLTSDEDMAMAYLTSYARTRHPRRMDQHQELEVMLESYLMQVEEIENEVNKINKNVSATENMISIHLDSVRNQLMKADLALQIMTVCITSGTLMAGFFGMNLLSHAESHPYAFYAVGGLIVSGTILGVLAGFRIARRRKLL